jgi:putative chitinase
MFDADRWTEMLRTLGCSSGVATAWAPVCAEFLVPERFSLGREEIDDFLAQIIHESAHLSRLEENLRYSAQRLTQVWPSRFPTVEAATPFAYNPVALAEKVYGGRMGNDHPGDGWLYRGRGPIMLTGAEAYELAQVETGLALVDKPELAATPRGGMLVSIAWWERRIPDHLIGNVDLVSRRVNGGSNGLAERRTLAALTDQLIHQA